MSFEVEWGDFFLVAAAAVVASLVLSGFTAGGVRLVSDGRESHRTSLVAGGMVCFAVCVAAVLFGLSLLVPALHGG